CGRPCTRTRKRIVWEVRAQLHGQIHNTRITAHVLVSDQQMRAVARSERNSDLVTDADVVCTTGQCTHHCVRVSECANRELEHVGPGGNILTGSDLLNHRGRGTNKAHEEIKSIGEIKGETGAEIQAIRGVRISPRMYREGNSVSTSREVGD